MTRIHVYEMAWKEAQVDSTGPAMTFLDALYRYWEPVILADPMFCGAAPVKAQIPSLSAGYTTASKNAAETLPPSSSAAAAAAAAAFIGNKKKQAVPGVAGSLPTLQVKLVPEKDFDAEDIVFLAEAQSKSKSTGNKRRKDTHYLGGSIKY